MPVSERAPSALYGSAARAAFPGPMHARFCAAHERLAGAGYGAAVPQAFATAARLVAERLGPEAGLALGAAASLMAIRVRPVVAARFLDTSASVARQIGSAEGFLRWVDLSTGMIDPPRARIRPGPDRAYRRPSGRSEH